MSERFAIINKLYFGNKVAENERENYLKGVFVKTSSLDRVLSGDKDIILASKGMGKSSLYLQMLYRTRSYKEKGIFLTSSTNLQWNSVSRFIRKEEKSTEEDFLNMWKYLFAKISSDILVKEKIASDNLLKKLHALNHLGYEFEMPTDTNNQVNSELKLIKLIKQQYFKFKGWASKNFKGSKRAFRNANIDVGGKKYTVNVEKLSLKSLDDDVEDFQFILNEADVILKKYNKEIWIALDALDETFSTSNECIESNAIRSLLRVHRELKDNKITPKIFLRTDIMKRITKEKNFINLSHVNDNSITLVWSDQAILNLIINRILSNELLISYLDIDPSKYKTRDSQETLLNRIFPKKQKESVFRWLLNDTRNGHGQNTPRELIDWLDKAKDIQIREIEDNLNLNMPEEKIFTKKSFIKARTEVSKSYLIEVMYAEHHVTREYIEKLQGEHYWWNIDQLKNIWKCSRKESDRIAQNLVDVGFFEKTGGDYTHRIPSLFRHALELKSAKE